MAYELRRFLPRQFADWPGTYIIEDDHEQRSGDCRIIDISSAGAGLELFDEQDEAREGRRIIVAVHLRGEIRNARPGRHGHHRVGIQFADTTDAERAYLSSLTQLEAHW
jgi:hypothetical protein